MSTTIFDQATEYQAALQKIADQAPRGTLAVVRREPYDVYLDVDLLTAGQLHDLAALDGELVPTFTLIVRNRMDYIRVAVFFNGTRTIVR